MKKEGYRRKTTFKKIKHRVSPGFGWVIAAAGLLTNLDWSSHRIDPSDRSGFNNYGSNAAGLLLISLFSSFSLYFYP
jgi:predicted membrane channel-forming protein YqfA (hemolysin III family)